MELNVTSWASPTPLSEEAIREELEQQELKVYNWSSPPQGVFAGHTHGYHKVLYVLSGSIKFEFPTRHKSINLQAGDRLDLPAGVRHSATVGMDGVTCLESHIF